MDVIFIYGLIDPIKNDLRYVGKSVNPNNRYRKHLQESKNKITYKDKWVNKLLQDNLRPELIIIDVVSEENWEFWEKFYISYFKYIGCRLTNLTEGGDNPPNLMGRKRTKDEIERIRESNLGKKRSEQTKNNISLSKVGKPIPHLNNGKERSLLHRNNLSLSLTGRTSPNKGKKFSDEHKEKLSKSSTRKKMIVQMNLNGDVIKIWNSITEAQKELKIRHISECCSNNETYKTAGGYKWKFKN